jgi:2-polyprenyl-6-methoxyphenol hydroxylase-like FAD-dependent oxidoreductase
MFSEILPLGSNGSSEPERLERDAAQRNSSVDIAIVGGGLAGAIAAVMLGRGGYRVALFDIQKTPQPEFRAEQLVGAQVGRLAELGLLESLTQSSRLCPEAINGRSGKIIDRTVVDQYGVPYHRMVAAARSELPPTVQFVTGRVASLETGADIQKLVVADGETVTARLVVLATGLSSVLPKRLGIEYKVLHAGHSLAIGFDVSAEKLNAATTMPLVYYGERPSDKIDYIALFPMEGTLRANLFSYHEARDEWTRGFCKDPHGALLSIMPGLEPILGSFAVTSPVQTRSNDLRVARNPVQPGVVLVGDAFQTPCPAAGTGIDRLLSDLNVLCTSYIPAWFASPGMGQDKIAGYYADPSKQAVDAECLRLARYRRALSTEEGLRWTLHRKQVFIRRSLRAKLSKATWHSKPPTIPSMVPSS